MIDTNNSKIGNPFPFKVFCQKVIPLAFDESMSYLELLYSLLHYLKEIVIPAVNNNAEAVEELQNLYNELKSYVDNYFDNLDVQEEINNKLDEMAESGELTEIISQYLQLASIFGYDTISEMKTAENLTIGSICRTLGRNTYNDGYGNFYRVRQVLSTDVIDNYNIVSFNNLPTLVAERIINNYLIDAFQSTNERIDNIEEQLINKKWIFVGDSYAEPPEGITPWTTQLKQKMNLSDNEVIFAHHGGAGFANPSYPFYDIINELTSDDSVTDILIAGGYNDLTFSMSNIVTGITNVKTLINTKFPNAKIHIAVIGGTTTQYHGNMHLLVEAYVQGCLDNDLHYLKNLEYTLYQAQLFLSDGIHPNQYGQNAIAKNLFAALNGGFEYIRYNQISIDTAQSDHFPSVDFPLHIVSKNDITILSNYSGTKYLTASQTFELTYNGSVKIGKIDQNGIIGTDYYSNCQLTLPNIVIQDWSSDYEGYYNVPAFLYIDKDGFVYLRISQLINPAHDNFMTFPSVHQIQIPNFSVVYPTIIM